MLVVGDMELDDTDNGLANPDKAVIFHTRSYEKLSARLVELSGLVPGEIECKNFPDGERYHRLRTSVSDREALIVSGTINDEETLELFDLCNAIVDGGASRLRVIMPYYGYSTMERSVKSGEAVKAKYRARLLSNAVPDAPLGNRFYFLDLHSDGIPQYFENGAHAIHVYAKPIVVRAAIELARKYGESNGDSEKSSTSFVFASTDAGRMKWVESLARDMGVSPAFAYKERIDGARTVSLGVSGPVQGNFVVIYDDMIRTGSSLLNAANAYMTAGARGIAVIATHALFPGDALKMLQESGVIKEIVVTDSHPRARQLESDFLRVECCAELFLPYIKDLANVKESVDLAKKENVQ